MLYPLIGLALASSALAGSAIEQRNNDGGDCTAWFKVKPIHWTNCPDVSGFKCGFVDLPMDYLDSNCPDRVNVALRMYPATVPSKQRLGSLFFNPGSCPRPRSWRT